MKRLAVIVTLLLAGGLPIRAEDAPKENASAKLHQRIKAAFERARGWIEKNHKGDGTYGANPRAEIGVNALILKGLVDAPLNLSKDDKVIKDPLQFILRHQQDDGSIHDGTGLENYRTSLSLMALVSLNDPQLKPVIEKAKKYLLDLQATEQSGYDKDKHWSYGGIGYGGAKRSDVSNLQTALSALKEAGVPKGSKVYKDALVFLTRCQNLTGTNELPRQFPQHKELKLGNDGGFMYEPGQSKADPEKDAQGNIIVTAPSYGSMTYAGLMSMLYANVGKDDPRVVGAYNWIRRNYSLEKNVGLRSDKRPAAELQGLYYYYHTMAKGLAVYGERYLETIDGKKHDWAVELTEKLLALQRADGYWINQDDRWMEQDPTLVTGYVLNTLNILRKFIEEQERPAAEREEKP